VAKGFRGAATFVALYCCAGCDGRPAAAAEDRGPMLAADVASIGATTFAWLSGDAEIALVTSGSQLVAVRVQFLLCQFVLRQVPHDACKQPPADQIHFTNRQVHGKNAAIFTPRLNFSSSNRRNRGVAPAEIPT